MTNPMLADDWKEEKAKFPVVIQPKIDGVRGINHGFGLTARTTKKFDNLHSTMFFSQGGFTGFDGELAAEDERHPRLCNLTTSALTTIQGEPWLMWHIFDFVNSETIRQPYLVRLQVAAEKVLHLKNNYPLLGAHLKLIPWVLVHNMDDLQMHVQKHIAEGYEGTIVRDPNGMHKQGRSTPREGGLLRIKGFVEEDAVVIRVEEGKQNNNEATINGLGLTERSTHKANMIPNGMVGALICTDVNTGQEIKVSAGRLTHEERVRYFQNQDLILGKTIKYQHFLKGRKDKPRFPTFQSMRAEVDKV